MFQQKRFGRRIGLNSTVQIIRELKIMVRRDAEAASSARAGDPAATPVSAAPTTGSR